MQGKRKTIIGLIISALFLVLIFYNVDIKELIGTFKKFELRNIVLIVSMYAFSLYIRAVRWRMLLLGDKRFSMYALCSNWVIGNLINAFIPARAGDIWRAYELGNRVKESKMKIFGSVMLERIMDGLSVCVLLYCCVLMYTSLIWVRQISNIAISLFGGSLLTFYLIVKFEKTSAICSRLVELAKKLPGKIRNGAAILALRITHQVKLFVSGFEVLKSPYYTIQSLVLSVSIWFLECLMTYWVITSFGVKCPISAAMFAICFVALGSMIPSSSIYVGPYQYAYILALGIYFIPKTEALAIAVVHQSIFMGALIVFSAIFWGINMLLNLLEARKAQEIQDDLPQEPSPVLQK